MLTPRAGSVLWVIDMQTRLMPAICDAAGVIAAACSLVAAARRLEIPVRATLQYPRGLGPLVPDLTASIAPDHCFEKTAFGALAEPGIADAVADLRAAGRDHMVLVGAEAHVCVLQTALQLARSGCAVVVVRDAIGSRAPDSHRAALDRLSLAGIATPTAEMIVFEWLERADTPAFRDLLPSIR